MYLKEKLPRTFRNFLRRKSSSNSITSGIGLDHTREIHVDESENPKRYTEDESDSSTITTGVDINYGPTETLHETERLTRSIAKHSIINITYETRGYTKEVYEDGSESSTITSIDFGHNIKKVQGPNIHESEHPIRSIEKASVDLICEIGKSDDFNYHNFSWDGKGDKKALLEKEKNLKKVVQCLLKPIMSGKSRLAGQELEKVNSYNGLQDSKLKEQLRDSFRSRLLRESLRSLLVTKMLIALEEREEVDSNNLEPKEEAGSQQAEKIVQGKEEENLTKMLIALEEREEVDSNNLEPKEEAGSQQAEKLVQGKEEENLERKEEAASQQSEKNVLSKEEENPIAPPKQKRDHNENKEMIVKHDGFSNDGGFSRDLATQVASFGVGACFCSDLFLFG